MNITCASNAIREACGLASHNGRPWGVCWDTLKKDWFEYDLKHGCGAKAEPEFVCFGLGKMPLPLSETAHEVLGSLIRQVLTEKVK
jgi:hypothetical protein